MTETPSSNRMIDDINHINVDSHIGFLIAIANFAGFLALILIITLYMSLKLRRTENNTIRLVCRKSVSKCTCCFRCPRTYSQHISSSNQNAGEVEEQRLSIVNKTNSEQKYNSNNLTQQQN